MDLIWQGQRLLVPGNGLRVNWAGSTPPAPQVESVMVFNSSAYVNLYAGDYGNISGNRIITWSMWLDQVSGFESYTNVMQLIPSLISDSFVSNLDGSTISAVAHNTTSGFKYDLTGFGNQILNFEVKKSTSTIVYLKINGVEQTSVGTAYSAGATNSWRIGWGTKMLHDATIWDLKIMDYSMNIINSFPGHPNGDQGSAWGSSCTVFNSAGTRDIY
jgi:hypothetical protein